MCLWATELSPHVPVWRMRSHSGNPWVGGTMALLGSAIACGPLVMPLSLLHADTQTGHDPSH